MQIYSTTEEAWKPIPNFPGYEVSNFGQVRSYRTNNPNIFTQKPHILKLAVRIRGRLYANLFHNGKQLQTTVHRLVLIAFLGPCPDGMQGCHNDNNHLNNHISNLRWDTPKGNQHDRRKFGTAPQGEQNGRHKLKESDIVTIRRQRALGINCTTVAAQYDVTTATIYQICRGFTWRNVPGLPTK